nr:xylulose kinase-1 [Tanacetum cinerariifolium]
MVNLEFCDMHNMVAYLTKTEGSEGFHQIVDFLNASQIRYALTENPTIYVSLIKQFWQTATAKTLDNGEIELTATIDVKVKIITKASVRRHLQLGDYDGLSSFPTTKIFEQLFLMGSPTQSPAVDDAASTGVDVRYGGATTTVPDLEGRHGSESEVDRAVPELAVGSSKRAAAEELDHESSKRQKSGPEQGMNFEALQTKDDLVMLWSLVKEKFNSTKPTYEKEREIWVELKRLFKPDTDDELWKFQKHIHDLTWKLYDSYRVHHVSTEKGIDIYMLVEKEYPLSRETLTLALVAKLLVDKDNEMSRELLRKIFMQSERLRR